MTNLLIINSNLKNQRQHIKLKVLVIFIQIFLSGQIFGQANHSLSDEAIQELIDDSEDNWHKDLQKAKEAATKAFLALGPETPPKIRADAYAQYGISFYTDLNYDSAIYYYEKATKIAVEHKLDSYYYLAITTSAMAKSGRFTSINKLIDERIQQIDSSSIEYIKLLLIKLSASISMGSNKKADSTMRVLDRLFMKTENENTFRAYKKLKGQYFDMIAHYSISDSIFKELLSYYKESTNNMAIAEMYQLLASNAMQESRFQESSDYLIKSQALYDSLGYKYGQAKIDLSTGMLLSWMGKYNDASEYLFKSLQVFEKNKNRNQVMIAYYELGWVFASMQMEDRAKKYLSQALAIAKEISNIRYLGSIHNAYGTLYTNLKKYDLTIAHLDSAVHYQEITQNILSIAAAKFNKAVALEKLGRKEEALELYRYTYKVDKSLNRIVGLIEGEWVLGQYFMKNNNIDSAQYYFHLGEKRALALGENYFLLNIYQGLADLYSKTGNYKRANSYFQKSLEAQKKFYNENKALELATAETTHDLKNKENEINLMNLQKLNNEQTIALNQKTIQVQKNTLIALTIGLILLAILSYIIFRYLRVRTKGNRKLQELYNDIQEKQAKILAQSEELKEANNQVTELNQILESKVQERTLALESALAELDYFFYRASHDFRGPLTTLMGIVGISKTLDLKNETQELFQKVDITAKKLDGMVRKLQAVSFLGDNQNLKEPTHYNLQEKIEQICREVIENNDYNGKQFEYKLEVTSSVQDVYFHTTILQICISNLVENSIVFNDNHQIKIKIKAKISNNKLIISVADNGIGIEKDTQSEIFNMFRRSSPSSIGNGLGLYLVKKAVENLKGEIKLYSQSKYGSTFELSLPIPSENESQ